MIAGAHIFECAGTRVVSFNLTPPCILLTFSTPLPAISTPSFTLVRCAPNESTLTSESSLKISWSGQNTPIPNSAHTSLPINIGTLRSLITRVRHKAIFSLSLIFTLSSREAAPSIFTGIPLAANIGAIPSLATISAPNSLNLESDTAVTAAPVSMSAFTGTPLTVTSL